MAGRGCHAYHSHATQANPPRTHAPSCLAAQPASLRLPPLSPMPGVTKATNWSRSRARGREPSSDVAVLEVRWKPSWTGPLQALIASRTADRMPSSGTVHALLPGGRRRSSAVQPPRLGRCMVCRRAISLRGSARSRRSTTSQAPAEAAVVGGGAELGVGKQARCGAWYCRCGARAQQAQTRAGVRASHKLPTAAQHAASSTPHTCAQQRRLQLLCHGGHAGGRQHRARLLAAEGHHLVHPALQRQRRVARQLGGDGRHCARAGWTGGRGGAASGKGEGHERCDKAAHSRAGSGGLAMQQRGGIYLSQGRCRGWGRAARRGPRPTRG